MALDAQEMEEAGGLIDNNRAPYISFIIVNFNTEDLLANCLNSIKDTVKGYPFETFVVDNGSTYRNLEIVKRRFPDVKIIENRGNIGFSRANNMALKRMNGKYAVLLNPDTLLKDKAIEIIVKFMDENVDVGICGGQLLNPDGLRQNSIANIPDLATELTNKSLLRRLFPERYKGKEQYFAGPVEVQTLIGACMVIRKEGINDVGLMDEDYFIYLEETDWCLMFRKNGWKIFYHPSAEIYHYQGQSIKRDIIGARIEYWKSRYIFFKKHRGIIVRILLRTGLIIRLVIDFLISLLYNVATLFTIEKKRQRLKLYSALLIWHIYGCPSHHGLTKI